MRCMCRAPRFRKVAWRAECCDGDTPIGGVPKHILAVIAADRPQWPVRQAARGLLLVEAASAHGRTVAAMALRRPTRRQTGRRQDSSEGLGRRGRVDRGREAAGGRTAPPRATCRSGVYLRSPLFCVCLTCFSLPLKTFLRQPFCFQLFLFFWPFPALKSGDIWPGLRMFRACSARGCMSFYIFVFGTVGPTPPPLGRRRANRAVVKWISDVFYGVPKKTACVCVCVCVLVSLR